MMGQFEQLDQMLTAQEGMLRTSQVVSSGISKPVFYDYVRSRDLDRVAHGIYLSKDSWVDAMYLLHLRFEQAVFSHETALFFHDLTDLSLIHICTDPRGNLTRIDNALAQMPQRLEAAKAQLDNLYQQQAAAKEEVGKPFLYEEELRSKNARLVELDTLLNIDGKGQAHAEAVVAKSTRPSVLDHLKRPVPPRSTDTVSYTHLDTAYRNACGHFDRENAVIEGNAAVRRAVLGSKDMELIRLYSDVPEFRQRLHREVIDETYPKLHELLRPLSQEDIDTALCAWNGNIESKHAVVRYMKDHAREKDTAAWLAQEYGGSNSLFVVRAGSPEETQLPWPKVQRRIAQLIQEDRFYTEEEQDRFDNIDPIAIREALEERGIVNGQVADSEKLDNDPFIQQVMSDAEQIAAAEAEQTSEISISDEEYDAVRSPIPQRTSYDPAAPVYAVGDTVYIENDAYQITELREDTVQLLPTGMVYPIYRAERKEHGKDRFV